MKPTIGVALTGSFCTFRRVISSLEPLKEEYRLIPIFSEGSYETDSRFGAAEDFRKEVEHLCGSAILHTIPEVEPFGPKGLLDLLLVAPCTGNTIGKLANGIADSTVTFACKAHLRNGRPILLGISTNDGLSGSAENLGKLLNRKHYYFVPFKQDDPLKKPYSLVADFRRLPEAVALALEGKQIQPILL